MKNPFSFYIPMEEIINYGIPSLCLFLFLYWLITKIAFWLKIKYKFTIDENCKSGKISLLIFISIILEFILICIFDFGVLPEYTVPISLLLFFPASLVFLVLSFLKDSKKIYSFLSMLLTFIFFIFLIILAMIASGIGGM